MKQAVIYIHGKGGSIEEAKFYEPLFPAHNVIGFNYQSETPWDAKKEFGLFFNRISRAYDSVSIIANSIGAYYAMNASIDQTIETAYFISPVADMEALIRTMMTWANVTEHELKEKKEISTAFGETLSWEYLCYTRDHPLKWNVPTHILYGSRDNLTPFDIISAFSEQIHASLTVMENGEHWFHTEEQMEFLAGWLKSIQEKKR